MTYNVVSVTITATASPVDVVPPEGMYVFSPNGVMWPGTPGTLPIVPNVQHGTLVNGTATVQLVASDNFSAGVLNWDIIINIRGMPTVNASAMVVNFATGSTQSVWDILNTNGYSFVYQP
jgi:hypothetical protein